MLENEFPAVVGLPCAAIASLFIVLICDVSSREKLKFEILNVKFEGGSGQVVLWVFCFLAMTIAINTVWDKKVDLSAKFEKFRQSAGQGATHPTVPVTQATKNQVARKIYSLPAASPTVSPLPTFPQTFVPAQEVPKSVHHNQTGYKPAGKTKASIA